MSAAEKKEEIPGKRKGRKEPTTSPRPWTSKGETPESRITAVRKNDKKQSAKSKCRKGSQGAKSVGKGCKKDI